jgi:hypothetical protein
MVSMFVTVIVVYYVTHSDKKEMSPTFLIGMLFGFLTILMVKYFKDSDTTLHTTNVSARLGKLGGSLLYYVILIVVVMAHVMAKSNANDDTGDVQTYLGTIFALIISLWFIYASLPSKLTVKKTVYDDNGDPILKDKESSYNLNIDTTYKYLLPLFLFIGNINSPIIKLLNGLFLGGFIGSVNMFGYYYFIKEDIDVTTSDYNKCKNNNCQEIYEQETESNNTKTNAETSQVANIVSIIIGTLVFVGITSVIMKKGIMRGKGANNNSFIS